MTDERRDTSHIVGVRFGPAGRLHYFDATGFDLSAGDRVVVETEDGPRDGQANSEATRQPDPLRRRPRVLAHRQADRLPLRSAASSSVRTHERWPLAPERREGSAARAPSASSVHATPASLDRSSQASPRVNAIVSQGQRASLSPTPGSSRCRFHPGLRARFEWHPCGRRGAISP